MCEGLGFESGLDKKFHQAPVFYWLYTLLIVTGAAVALTIVGDVARRFWRQARQPVVIPRRALG